MDQRCMECGEFLAVHETVLFHDCENYVRHYDCDVNTCEHGCPVDCEPCLFCEMESAQGAKG
jgi:hypothetical protein